MKTIIPFPIYSLTLLIILFFLSNNLLLVRALWFMNPSPY